eukprot:5637858-Pyramimonas_sp.AAC.1
MSELGRDMSKMLTEANVIGELDSWAAVVFLAGMGFNVYPEVGAVLDAIEAKAAVPSESRSQKPAKAWRGWAADSFKHGARFARGHE